MMVRSITQTTSALMIALGIAMIVVTLTRGFGVGILLGVLFIAAGVGRLLMLRRKESR
jgi:hypothetical protein